MNSTIRPKPCKICSSPWHTPMFHKPRKPISGYAGNGLKQRKPIQTKTVPKRGKRPKQQSDKEKYYQIWKETVARPALIEREGNQCWCCTRPAFINEKLDIEHTLGKGSHPELKRDLNNLHLYCRFPCHRNKTDGIQCSHDRNPYLHDLPLGETLRP